VLLAATFCILTLIIRLFCKDSTGNSPFWPANGALVVACLVLPRRLSLGVIGACLAANTAINSAFGYSLFDTFGFAILNSVLSVLTATLIRRFCGAATDLSRFHRFAAFCAIAVASAAFEAGLGELADTLFAAAPTSVGDWAQWTLDDSLGLIISTPAILLILKGKRNVTILSNGLWERLALLGLTTGVTVAAFLSPRSPAFLLVYPLLVLVAFRSGPAWVLGSVMAVSLLASAFTAHGLGPLSYLSPNRPVLMEGAIQTFLISLFLCAIPANNVIGERNRTARRLAALHDAARAARRDAVIANAAKSQFIANISHEIRTPLNGVLGMTQALAVTDLSELQRSRLDVIHSSGEVLLGLLNDVLDFSKIEAGKLELESAVFDVEALLHEVHDTFAPLADAKALTISLQIAPDLQRYVYGDAARVRQIVSNLVSNAVKFTERGSVTLVARMADSVLIVEVIDTGIGIPEDKLGKLFGKFEQVDASTTRRFGGTGLGLSISLDLARLMGGEVKVQSRLGAGSTFSVHLPVTAAPQEAPALQADAPYPVDSLADASQGAVKILAAEDNKTNQLVLKTLLGELGLEPVIVENGLEALEAWRAGAFDLILMDMQMPVMDGRTATQALRAEETKSARPRTPIIALTADVMAHQIASYRAVGIDNVVGKPIEFQKLIEAMNAALSGEDAPATEARSA
jgi:signal transduction histidine kinase/CheY-like chemotaxis protein